MSYQWRDDDDDDIPARRPDTTRSEVVAATVLAVIAVAVVLWLIWSNAMTTITKTTVLDLQPANANWMVTIEREDYADPAEEPGVLLGVGRTSVMLTLAEARTIGGALHAAYTGGLVVALMDALATVVDEDEDTDDDGPETCERCNGSGIHRGAIPGTYRYNECPDCGGTGRA